MANLKYNANGEVVGSVEINGTTIMQPVDIQSRLSTTIQTHNAVSVAASSSSVQPNWMDCSGFSDISITVMNDAATSSSVNINWSNDGTTFHGDEQPIAASTSARRTSTTKIKARYARFVLNNADTAAHTMSAWAYLNT